MKTKLVVLAGFIIGLFSCREDPVIPLSPVWGIEFSNLNTADLASGMITLDQNATKVTYFVDWADIHSLNQDDYQLMLVFTSGDSLRFIINKKENFENFHFPQVGGQNPLLYVILNGDTLSLKESVLSIQPKRGENKVYATLDIHALEGDISGTASKIPLVGVGQ